MHEYKILGQTMLNFVLHFYNMKSTLIKKGNELLIHLYFASIYCIHQLEQDVKDTLPYCNMNM